ncbi:MAG: hypothetical protein LQ340_005460 [Diploschistes diacapsis]|nr:MAG: hypothetical protein LQ340_005460 [Diploschistes diacapsis]
MDAPELLFYIRRPLCPWLTGTIGKSMNKIKLRITQAVAINALEAAKKGSGELGIAPAKGPTPDKYAKATVQGLLTMLQEKDHEDQLVKGFAANARELAAIAKRLDPDCKEKELEDWVMKQFQELHEADVEYTKSFLKRVK